jgi:hypothetical protein
VDDQVLPERDDDRERLDVLADGFELGDVLAPVDELVLVVPPDREHVVGVPDPFDDRQRVRPLPDEVTDEHHEVVRGGVQNLEQTVELVGTAVDVADDVDISPRRLVDPVVSSGDRRSQPGLGARRAGRLRWCRGAAGLGVHWW